MLALGGHLPLQSSLSRGLSHVDSLCKHARAVRSDQGLPPLLCFGYDASRDRLQDHRVGIEVDAQVGQLVKDMNRSIAEADKFIQTMENEPA